MGAVDPYSIYFPEEFEEENQVRECDQRKSGKRN